MLSRLFILATVILLAGCSTANLIPPDPALNKDNSAQIVVYRPSNDILGVAIELRVFINDQPVGTLNSGGADVLRFVSPGATTVAVKPYFMGIQDGKIASTVLMAELGKTHYLRLSREIGMPITVGYSTYTIGDTTELTAVTKEGWKGKH